MYDQMFTQITAASLVKKTSPGGAYKHLEKSTMQSIFVLQQ